MNSDQELFFAHLDDSLAALKVAMRRAINIDDNRQSHLDDAGAARAELERAGAQLLFTLGVTSVTSAGAPLARVVVAPGTDVYAGGFYGSNLPTGNQYLLRSTFTDPIDIVRDTVSLGSLFTLIPRL